MRVPFVGPSYTLDSRNASVQRCVNLYPEQYEVPPGKENEVAHLAPTPGLSAVFTAPGAAAGQPVRGMHKAKNIAYIVIGDKLFIANASMNTFVSVGTLNTNSGTVSMASNGLIVVMVDGDFGYYINAVDDTGDSTTFAQITRPGFRGGDIVEFQDGYFIFNAPDTDEFYISNLYPDITTGPIFDDTEFARVEGQPDNLVSIINNHRELWMFGEDTTEVWYNSGNADFPFERIQGAYLEIGCIAPHSVAKVDGLILWLGSNERGYGTVYMSQGYQAQRVSTHAVELAIQNFGQPEQATAYTYQQDGHTFYVINFTASNTTWVYDITTGLWHERAYTNTTTGKLERHRADVHLFIGNRNYVGDYSVGKVYALRQDRFTDDGREITRLRSSPHYSDDLHNLFYHSLQLDMETGVGVDESSFLFPNATDLLASALDPVAILRISRDGGHTWSSEKQAKIGKIGEKLSRVEWRRLGRARDIVFEVSITAPVKIAILGATVQAEKGVD